MRIVKHCLFGEEQRDQCGYSGMNKEKSRATLDTPWSIDKQSCYKPGDIKGACVKVIHMKDSGGSNWSENSGVGEKRSDVLCK